MAAGTLELSEKHRDDIRRLKGVDAMAVLWGMLQHYGRERLSQRELESFFLSLKREFPDVFCGIDEHPGALLDSMAGLYVAMPLVQEGDPDGYRIRQKQITERVKALEASGFISPQDHDEGFRILGTLFALYRASVRPPAPQPAAAPAGR